jgi:hypothetical protein
MNLIRGPEPERRVAPIDSGPRTRVKAGLRRDQPRDWLDEKEAREEFSSELAQEDSPGRFDAQLQPDPDSGVRQTEDRVEIEGLAAQAPPADTPQPGPRLDVKV